MSTRHRAGRLTRMQLAARRICTLMVFIELTIVSAIGPAVAQSQFGGQERANAARDLLVTAIQQQISALPGSSPQPLFFKRAGNYQQAVEALVLNEPEPFEEGVGGLRLTGSYFHVSDEVGPALHQFHTDQGAEGFAKLGLAVDASVGVFNASARYGLPKVLDKYLIDLSVAVPLVIANVRASQTFTARAADPLALAGAATQADLDHLLAGRTLFINDVGFGDQGFDFPEGTSVGVGRITVGTKMSLLPESSEHAIGVSIAPEFLCPSPNEGQFAGSASPAFGAHLIVGLPARPLQVLWNRQFETVGEVGYEHDFYNQELSRFTWKLGASIFDDLFRIEVGAAGSRYNEPIQWTPQVTHGAATPTFPESTLKIVGTNELGTTQAAFFIATNLRPFKSAGPAVGLAVSVPVVGDFSPDAAVSRVLSWAFSKAGK